MHASVSDSRNLPVSSNASPCAPGSCLNPTALSLPYYDNNSKINAMYQPHTDEYFALKGVPKDMHFATALHTTYN